VTLAHVGRPAAGRARALRLGRQLRRAARAIRLGRAPPATHVCGALIACNLVVNLAAVE